ncbi:hypothetical protein EV426DRAFT_715278 [Tirmania nivea]|nr:hypothetical protein EV426DRAFT_715278 [Tirmania nivea]
MDVLLALAAGVVLFSYFVPTVEAYDPEEQQGTSKRPASRQLESRREGYMPGDYPRQRQPQSADGETSTSADEKEQEGAENEYRDGLETQDSSNILHEEERAVVPETVAPVESAMLRNLRDQTLLEQLGGGSYAGYAPGPPRQEPPRPVLTPATVHHAPLFLYNHIPPATIGRTHPNGQELLQTVPLNSGLIPLDPPAAVTANSPLSLGEAGDPPLETRAYGATVPYVHPGVRNVPTSNPIRNRIPANQYPQRQLMNSRPHQDPPTSYVSNTNRANQYPLGQLAIPRYYQNPNTGYNYLLGLSFHPPLVIGFNRNSRIEQGNARIPPANHRGPRNLSFPLPNDALPVPPRSFEATAWERRSSARLNALRITPTGFEASIWESYSSTRVNVPRSNPNRIASSDGASEPIIPSLPHQEISAQTNGLTLAIANQSDPSTYPSSREYVAQRGAVTRVGLPSANEGGGLTPPSGSTNPSLPRAIASLHRLPLVQGSFDRPPPYELSATPSGLLYLPTNHIMDGVTSSSDNIPTYRHVASEDTGPAVPSRRHNRDRLQNFSRNRPIELTGPDSTPTRERQNLPEAQTNQPPASVHNDTLPAQLQHFASSSATEGARPPSGNSGARPTMAGIVRPRADQGLCQPKPENPFRNKGLRDRDFRELPEIEWYGARGLSLRGGEAPNYRAMVPLRPPWTSNRKVANNFHHILALSTEKPVNQQGERAAIEHSKASVVSLPHYDLAFFTHELVKGVEDSRGVIDFEWKITEPTFEFSVGSTVTLNPLLITSSHFPSTTCTLNLSGDVTDAGATGGSQAISAPPSLQSQESRVLSPPPLGSSNLPTPPPSWRPPNHQSPSRIPIPRRGATYHGHLSPSRRAGLFSTIPPSPTRPPTPPKPLTKPPTPPKTPPLISTPTIQNLHQPSVEDPPSTIQAEDSSLSKIPFSAEIEEIEPGPPISRSLPLFNRPKKLRNRLTEESLRVWILRQCYLAKLNAAYEEARYEEEEVVREDLMDLEVPVEDGGSFI